MEICYFRRFLGCVILATLHSSILLLKKKKINKKNNKTDLKFASIVMLDFEMFISTLHSPVFLQNIF